MLGARKSPFAAAIHTTCADLVIERAPKAVQKAPQAGEGFRDLLQERRFQVLFRCATTKGF
jgi:hypothetical protein